MNTAFKVAFGAFVASLLVTVILGLRRVWLSVPPSELEEQILISSVIVLFATLFYIPVGEAMHRVLSDRRLSRNDVRD